MATFKCPILYMGRAHTEVDGERAQVRPLAVAAGRERPGRTSADSGRERAPSELGGPRYVHWLASWGLVDGLEASASPSLWQRRGKRGLERGRETFGGQWSASGLLASSAGPRSSTGWLAGGWWTGSKHQLPRRSSSGGAREAWREAGRDSSGSGLRAGS